MRPLRITIVLPFVHLTGGIRMMLEHANGLHRVGHRVLVSYPFWPYRFHFTRQQQLRELRAQLTTPSRVTWFSLDARLCRVPLVRSLFLPPADIVVATSWPTAHDVARLHPSRGGKVQVLMHHEQGTGPVSSINATYALPLGRIALSTRLRDEFQRDHGVRIEAVVPAGVNARVFYPEGSREPRTVLMLYHADPRKGAEDGIGATARLRRRLPDVRVVWCGALRPDVLPDGVEFVASPNDEALRRLYSRATVLLYPSRYEGFGLPPLEAMACGCPVVTTAVGAVPEFAVDGENAAVVQPGDVGGLATRLERVLTDPVLQVRLSGAGLETAATWTTERAAAEFGQVLRRLAGPGEDDERRRRGLSLQQE